MRFAIPIWLMLSAASAAEVIDRIAVTVGNQVITTSDLDREIRVTAFLNGTHPDFSLAGKRNTADRMVQQRLVKRELELSRYPAPALSDVDPVLQKFKEEHYPDPAAYQRALSTAGITEQQVRDQIFWQLTFLRFIEVRFRPGIQVSEEEIKEYFEKVVKGTSLDELHDRIEELLIQQKVDKELETWIQEVRKRVGVEYRPEVFPAEQCYRAATEGSSWPS